MARRIMTSTTMGGWRRWINLATILGFLGILVSAGAIYFGYKGTNALQESQKKANSKLEDLDTKSVEEFPWNIIFVNEKIFAYANENQYVEKIEIYTDVIGYGMLSHNSNWNKYFQKIKTVINNNPRLKLTWHYYDDDLLKNVSENQFARFNGNPDSLASYMKSCIANLFCEECKIITYTGECQYGEKGECQRIKRIKDYATLISELDSLQKERKEDLENFKNSIKEKNRVTLRELKDNTLPFHAWFVFEKGDNVPVRGVITFPSYIGKSTERGIYTTNRDLLRTMHEILEFYLISQNF